jgi:GNAT superfamily N-acetyltransferase
MTVKFRAIKNSDQPFLQKLYFSTRWKELEPVPWSNEQKDVFLKSQFDAQHSHYQKYFPAASFDLVLYKNVPIGRLYLDRRADEIRIIDIALLPEYRNRGIGSQLLQDVIADAAKSRLLVRIHVEQHNPAMGLYERLGFKKIHEEGVYWLMEWKP